MFDMNLWSILCLTNMFYVLELNDISPDCEFSCVMVVTYITGYSGLGIHGHDTDLTSNKWSTVEVISN